MAVAALDHKGRKLHVWAIAEGAEARESDAGDSRSVVWSADSKRLALVGDKTATIIDAGTLEVLHNLAVPAPTRGLFGAPSHRAALSPVADRLALGDRSRVLLIDTASGEITRTHSASLIPRLWSPDGKHVIGSDGTALDAEHGGLTRWFDSLAAGACRGAGGIIAAPGPSLTVRRKDGKLLEVWRIPVKDSWQLASVSSGGGFDGGDGAIARLRRIEGKQATHLGKAMKRIRGLRAAFLRGQ